MGSPDEVISVLAVTAAEEEVVFLEHLFSHSKWKLDVARSCGEARRRLQIGAAPVVLCSRHLPDGTWRDLLAESSAWPERPRLIVMARSADDQLWAEVLDQGGYDLLAQPLDTREVVRVISLAWRQWRSERERKPAER